MEFQYTGVNPADFEKIRHSIKVGQAVYVNTGHAVLYGKVVWVDPISDAVAVQHEDDWVEEYPAGWCTII